MAMRLGKHVYCEKPLTHSVYEARVVAEAAAKAKVATQMGTQIHAERQLPAGRRADPGRGDRPGPRGPRLGRRQVLVGRRAADRDAARPDACTGTSGSARRPSGPTTRPISPPTGGGGGTSAAARSATWPATTWTCPSGRSTSGTRSRSRPKGRRPPRDGPAVADRPLRVPARGDQPARHPDLVRRRQAARRSSPRRTKPCRRGTTGVLFVGDKGMLLADYGRHLLLPEAEFKDFKAPEPTIPNSIGHHNEWIAACKTGQPDHLQLRLLRRPDRDRPARQRRLPRRPEARLGRRTP